MAVVINEFEVMPAEQAKPAAANPPATGASEPPPLTPQELADLVRRQLERAARVWAH